MMNLFKRVMRAGNATEAIAWATLKHTAEHKSFLIRDVASDLDLSMEQTLAVRFLSGAPLSGSAMTKAICTPVS
jgi:hypothetical protein